MLPPRRRLTNGSQYRMEQKRNITAADTPLWSEAQIAANPTLSPCVQICTLNDQQLCIGCRRSLDEIVGWAGMSAAEKARVMAELPSREA